MLFNIKFCGLTWLHSFSFVPEFVEFIAPIVDDAHLRQLNLFQILRLLQLELSDASLSLNHFEQIFKLLLAVSVIYFKFLSIVWI